jgi:hypothetical protein
MIIGLIKNEVDFERSVISGHRVMSPTATPRQGNLNQETYDLLLRQVARGLVQYVVFSYITPIAWVYTNGSVCQPEITYTRTTNIHQRMVEEAFGERVNHNLLPEPVEGDEHTLVVLSENEEIILRRMRDEYGTEYRMVTGSTSLLEDQKAAPRDQVEPLGLKGLVEFGSPTVARLTDKGRAHLDKIQPVVSQKAQASQYVELTEDELIELADDLGAQVYASGTAGEGRRAALEMTAVVRALKARRDATAPARRRIGEYLRQQGIVEAQYEKDINSDSDYAKRNAKPVQDILDELRADKYAGKAMLKFSDLRMLVTPLVRDTKAEFEAEQQRRLELWKTRGLPEKQAAMLECIAKGHVTRYHSTGYTSYSGDNGGGIGISVDDPKRCQVCQRPDGRTMEAMRRKKVFTTLPALAYSAGGSRNRLMLTDPEKSDK